MRVALANSLDVGRDLSKSYDRVYVLNETFSDFENLISIPAALDGFDTQSRDAFLQFLGENVDLDWVDKQFQSAIRGLGTYFSELVTSLEMNLYADYPEAWDIAKATWLSTELSGKHGILIDSYLSKTCHVDTILLKSLHRGALRSRTSWTARNFSRVLRSMELIISLGKGQLWLFVLAARSFVSPRFQSPSGSTNNLIMCPRITNVSKSDTGFGPYWRYIEAIRGHFSGQLSPVYFSQGLFCDARGRFQRLQSRVGIGQSVFKVQVTLIKVLLKALKLEARRSDSDMSLERKLGALRPAFLRSIFGPSFVQSYWENLQFSTFFGHSKPKSVLFLCENQSWERALVTQGRRQSPQTLFLGVAHNAIRPWDLRYFKPHEWVSGPTSGRKSSPDLFLATSKVCLGRLKSYYPSTDKFRLVETLRFAKPQKLANLRKSEALVIAGSYSPIVNVQLLKFVEESLTDARLTRKLRVRSHPLRAIKSSYPRFDSETEFPWLTICDSTSTISAELAEMEAPHFVARFGHLPNMSPLADIRCFRSSFRLPGVQIEHLFDEASLVQTVNPGFEYYERDEDYIHWQTLIKEIGL